MSCVTWYVGVHSVLKVRARLVAALWHFVDCVSRFFYMDVDRAVGCSRWMVCVAISRCAASTAWHFVRNLTAHTLSGCEACTCAWWLTWKSRSLYLHVCLKWCKLLMHCWLQYTPFIPASATEGQLVCTSISASLIARMAEQALHCGSTSALWSSTDSILQCECLRCSP